LDKKYGEFVGVDNVHVAVIIEDSLDNYRTETPEYLAPVAEIAGEPEIETTPTYYDNVAGFNYVTEGTTPLTCTFSGVPARLAAKLLGKPYDAATGRVLDTGKPNPPYCALSFRYNKGPEDYRYYQYSKGNFSGGAEEAASQSNSVDVRTYQMTYTAVVTTHQWLIDGIMQGLKRIFGETTDENFSPNGWFMQTQTPDTSTPPAILALESSVPADNATGVAVDVTASLTFNNAVNSISALLMGPDLAPVEAAITFDSTKKIVTIAPSIPLAAASEHALVIAQVTDVFGQTIKDRVITFTTA